MSKIEILSDKLKNNKIDYFQDIFLLCVNLLSNAMWGLTCKFYPNGVYSIPFKIIVKKS